MLGLLTEESPQEAVRSLETTAKEVELVARGSSTVLLGGGPRLGSEFSKASVILSPSVGALDHMELRHGKQVINS